MQHRRVVCEHPTIENGRGERLKFYEVTTTPCQQCTDGKLGVYMEDSMTTTLHCIECDYMMSLKKDDFREVQRLIKAGLIPDPGAPKPAPVYDEPAASTAADVSEL